jgi:hypothetical protein
MASTVIDLVILYFNHLKIASMHVTTYSDHNDSSMYVI